MLQWVEWIAPYAALASFKVTFRNDANSRSCPCWKVDPEIFFESVEDWHRLAFGGNIQFLATAGGLSPGCSPVLPGIHNDLTWANAPSP